MGMEVDDVCLVIYKSTTVRMPPPPPLPLLRNPLPPNIDSLAYEKKRLAQEEKIAELREKNRFLSVSAITSEGNFNSKIIWKSKQCLDSIQIMELDSILSKKKMDESIELVGNIPMKPPPSPAKCYFPRHSIFLYKKGNVIGHYDICFECGRIKKEGSESLKGVRFKFLYEFYKSLKIPTGGEELKTYFKENKRTD